MRTLKEIYKETSQDTTLIKTFSTYRLDNALNGSEEDMVEAFSHFFASAQFPAYLSGYDNNQLLEYRLLSEFIKEIEPGCSSDIQRIISELMNNKKLYSNKKAPIVEACLIILFPKESDRKGGWITVLSKSACSTEIDAAFAFAQVLVACVDLFNDYLAKYPYAAHSSIWTKIFDICADNPKHLSMPIILLEFLQRYSRDQTSYFYFLSVTLKHGLTNAIFHGKYHDPDELVKRLCEWGKNHFDRKNHSDCLFLKEELPSLMIDCLIAGKTKALGCLETFLSHCIRNSEFREYLSTVLINSNQLELLKDKYSDNPLLSTLLEEASMIEKDAIPIRLSLFLASIRHSLANPRSNTFEIEFSPARAMAQVGVHPQSKEANDNKSDSLLSKTPFNSFSSINNMQKS